MLKVLKWDLLDFQKRYDWTLLSVPLGFLLALVPSNNHSTINSLMITLVSGLAALTGLYLIILAVFVCTNWLVGKQVQLYFSLPIAPWKWLLSKLILAGLINTVACLWGLQIMLIFGAYSTGVFNWISFQNLGGIPEVILFLVLIDAIFLFSFLLAKSISWARVRPILFS